MQKRQFVWKWPEEKKWPQEFYLHSAIAFNDVVVAHFGYMEAKNAIFGFNVEEKCQKELWSDFIQIPGRCQVGPVGNVLTKIYQEEKVTDYWLLDLMDVMTGDVLKTFKIDGSLLWGQESNLKNHDNTWYVDFSCETQVLISNDKYKQQDIKTKPKCDL
jgi:hypothetical protein